MAKCCLLHRIGPNMNPLPGTTCYDVAKYLAIYYVKHSSLCAHLKSIYSSYVFEFILPKCSLSPVCATVAGKTYANILGLFR